MSEQSTEFGDYSWAAMNVAQAIADAAEDFYGKNPEHVTWGSVSEAEDILAELVEVAARIERACPRSLNNGSWASRNGPKQAA